VAVEAEVGKLLAAQVVLAVVLEVTQVEVEVVRDK
jgi:hypothetical protein